MTSLVSKPTLVEHGGRRFLIMDAPKSSNLHLYLKECERHGVTDMVRICEETYSASEVQAAGITLHEMRFEDGDSPPEDVIRSWLQLVDHTFPRGGTGNEKKCIAVHCVAGLGRAPVLVAIALIENNLEPEAAVAFIRERRRGAINNKQLSYLETYERTTGSGCNCLIL